MVPAPNSRLNELLDQLRQEFENQSRSTGEFEHQRKCTFLFFLLSYSRILPDLGKDWKDHASIKILLRQVPLTHRIAVTGQLQEMEMIRQKVYQLEQAQLKMKQEYVP